MSLRKPTVALLATGLVGASAGTATAAPQNGIELGDHVLVAGQCYIGGGRYGTKIGAGPMVEQGHVTKGPVVIGSLFWKRMTRNGAIAGMFAGAATVLLWKQTGSALYEIVPGFIAGGIAIVVVSLLGRAPSAEVQAQHEQVRLTLKESGH